ncbi:MAG: ribonuclease H family protein [Clostridiales bacterium]|jgi:ribonuclease HI|nr:ribonuclease H family protein [Clostridiales bacterium]
MANPKKNFYAVRRGRQTGIFGAWDECKRAVTGFKGAEFRGFAARDEAEAYMRGGDAPEAAEADPLCPVAYVDGSYDAARRIYGWGAVILMPDGETVRLSGAGRRPEYAVERNIAGEVSAAMESVAYCHSRGFDRLIIKHDYAGIGCWARGEWKAGKRCSNDYVKFIRQFDGVMRIMFVKVPAHSGVALNEEADALAGKAVREAVSD